MYDFLSTPCICDWCLMNGAKVISTYYNEKASCNVVKEMFVHVLEE